MFEYWYVAYHLAQLYYEKMQAEAQSAQTDKSESKTDKINNRRLRRTMLFVADLFIKAGMSLKRRWSPKDENSCNGLASSLDDL